MLSDMGKEFVAQVVQQLCVFQRTENSSNQRKISRIQLGH
jgi:hypothetical protein